MNRWTVFDSPTAEAAQQPDRTVEIHAESSVTDALADAIRQQRPVILVVSQSDDEATVARITPPNTPPE